MEAGRHIVLLGVVLQYRAIRYAFQLHRLHDFFSYILHRNSSSHISHHRYFLCILQLPIEEVQVCLAIETFEDFLRIARDRVLS
jgi:hypothetical protein